MRRHPGHPPPAPPSLNNGPPAPPLPRPPPAPPRPPTPPLPISCAPPSPPGAPSPTNAAAPAPLRRRRRHQATGPRRIHHCERRQRHRSRPRRRWCHRRGPASTAKKPRPSTAPRGTADQVALRPHQPHRSAIAQQPSTATTDTPAARRPASTAPPVPLPINPHHQHHLADRHAIRHSRRCQAAQPAEAAGAPSRRPR